MLLLTRKTWGSNEFRLMIQRGLVTPLGPHHALPCDIAENAFFRAQTFIDAAPCYISGAAGVWVHQGGDYPEWIDIVGRSGCHPPHAASLGNWRPHSRNLTVDLEHFGGVAVAPLPLCVDDALRWQKEPRR